jgi:hypothetical protein
MPVQDVRTERFQRLERAPGGKSIANADMPLHFHPCQPECEFGFDGVEHVLFKVTACRGIAHDADLVACCTLGVEKVSHMPENAANR